MDKSDLVKKDVSANCDIHGEFIGYEINIPGLSYTAKPKCQKCAALILEKKKEFNDKEHAATVERNIAKSGVPPRFINCSFSNFQAKSEGDEGRVKYLNGYIGNFEATKAPNLFLCGDIGIGKTHLCCAVATSLIKKNHTVVYTDVADFLSAQKDSMFDSETTSAEFMQRYTTCRLLILDEFGLNTPSDHEKTVLNILINKRYENMLPTMIAGNFHVTAVAKILGERANRRLVSEVKIITLGAE